MYLWQDGSLFFEGLKLVLEGAEKIDSFKVDVHASGVSDSDGAVSLRLDVLLKFPILPDYHLFFWLGKDYILKSLSEELLILTGVVMMLIEVGLDVVGLLVVYLEVEVSHRQV